MEEGYGFESSMWAWGAVKRIQSQQTGHSFIQGIHSQFSGPWGQLVHDTLKKGKKINPKDQSRRESILKDTEIGLHLRLTRSCSCYKSKEKLFLKKKQL